MIAIYRPGTGVEPQRLVEALQARGETARRISSLGTDLPAGSLVVCWGYAGRNAYADTPAIRVVNRHINYNKYHELEMLAGAGVPVPPHRLSSPPGPARWLGRQFQHEAALDLTNPPRYPPAYYSKFCLVAAEFRFHVFDGEAICSVVKRPNGEGRPYHPEFRTHRLGWVFCPLHFATPEVQAAQEAAIRAVAAVRYDFGAVDVGVRPDGQPLVFEVNSAPGISGDTVSRYVSAIVAAYREHRRKVLTP